VGATEIDFYGPISRNQKFINNGYNFRDPLNFNPNIGAYPEMPPWTSLYKLYGWETRQAQAKQETDALIDVLFEHENTAPFVSIRLIQRLVTSNPSPRYVKAVADAFTTGRYGDKTFSGKYGDLAATVAAILLDREARSPHLEADPHFGQMREPLLKVLHLMRSMEYKPKEGYEIMLQLMGKKIGQGSFQAPSVFSFYQPDYAPDGQVADAGLVAPEAALGTGPFTVGYLNGMDSLIEHGLTSCGRGYGDNFPLTKRDNCVKGTERALADGYFTYALDEKHRINASAAVDELATLLAPGRLSTHSRAVMEAAYANSSLSDGKALEHVLKLFTVAPEFHTTNLPHIQPHKRLKSAETQSHGRPYKAVVLVVLEGGADSFSMLVPHTCAPHDLYAEYASIRGGSLALDKSDLLTISLTGESDPQPCSTFGLHPRLTHIYDAYNDGDAMVFANIGAMVEPMTRDDFYKQRKEQPLGNFGHGGMNRACQSVDAANKNAKGILGRMVAATLGDTMKSNLYSATGAKKAVEGSIPPSIVQPQEGIIRYQGYSKLKHDIDALHSNASQSVFTETISKTIEDTLRNTESLGQLLSATTLSSRATFGYGESVGAQLKEVAKLIAVDTKNQNMERAAFVVAQRAYDTHNSFDALDGLLTTLNYGLESFTTEMKAQGLWENVTVVLVSDFARTLTSNTQGTDHGWGGNYFMLGGSVRGGTVKGRYPDRLIEEESDLNIGRGRFIPMKPWEAVWNGIVEWWDILDPHVKASILPLAKNWSPNEIFNRTDLFKN
jgi:uncharacterized protein (DUF1501 family)